MLMLAFRDWRLGLIALIPNATPILIVVGVMGWAGLKVNVATAMLASVSMGLAVDFSIHYLYRFQHELRSGKSFHDAVRDAHGSVGLAMVLANIALIAGFSTLVISAFIPTVHFGLLVSVAMLGGLVGNLISLPILLRLLYARGHSQSP
jgi:predicted RND superfamily exporter protein